jgi:hypothetical protein
MLVLREALNQPMRDECIRTTGVAVSGCSKISRRPLLISQAGIATSEANEAKKVALWSFYPGYSYTVTGKQPSQLIQLTGQERASHSAVAV